MSSFQTFETFTSLVFLLGGELLYLLGDFTLEDVVELEGTPLSFITLSFQLKLLLLLELLLMIPLLLSCCST